MNYLVEVVKKYLNQDDAGVVEKTTFNNIFSAAGYFQSLAWYTFVSTFILGGDEDDAIRNAIDSANAAVDRYNSFRRACHEPADVVGEFELVDGKVVVYYSGSGTMYFFVPDRNSVILMYRIKTSRTRSEDDRWVRA